MVKFAPSILNADFSNLEAEIVKVSDADYLHLDVMDGHFVPNITFGPCLIKALRPLSSLKFDTHLMIEKPEKFIEDFAEAGSDIITIHQEATYHLDRVINLIKNEGCLAGVSLNPATPLNELEYVLENIDLVLLMSVNPGFGGQQFIPGILKKIAKLKNMINKYNPTVKIEVDGGINTSNIRDIVRAGVDIIVVGSAIFKNDNPSLALKNLKHKSILPEKDV